MFCNITLNVNGMEQDYESIHCCLVALFVLYQRLQNTFTLFKLTHS